jgi:hypothetical protein
MLHQQPPRPLLVAVLRRRQSPGDTRKFQAYIAEDAKKLKDAVHKIGKVE